MCAEAHSLSVVQNKNLVRILDGGGTLGNQQDGTVLRIAF